MKHSCIKPACDNSYESNDPDAYYCPSCVEVNKALAKKIDAQVAARPKRKAVSSVKAHEEAMKTQGMQVGAMRGLKVSI